MNEFEKIISFECLYKAHRRARLGKRWKKEVIDFEAKLSQNLWKLHYDLQYGKYKTGAYHKFMIYDPKEREIQAISYLDRIVQHSLCDNYLIPLLEKRLIYDNCACRKKKGTNFAFKRFRQFMTHYYKRNGKKGYFVKIDVKKYFPSIDHEILIKKLSALVQDEKILALLIQIINSFESSPGKGLPMGNQTSQCFALLYLDEIDRMIKEKYSIRYYIRYMDDIILILRTKEEAKNILQAVTEKLTALKLTINRKSQYFCIKNGITFLGWRFFFSPTGAVIQKIQKSTKRRILFRIGTILDRIKNNLFSVNRKRQMAVSYRGHLSYGKAYSFCQKVKNKIFKKVLA